MFISAAIQGSVGFGANVLAIPILLLLDPALVPAPALLAGFSINILMMIRDRAATSPRPVAGALVGRFLGTIAGVVALSLISDRGLSILVACTVLVIVGISASTIAPSRSLRNMLCAGTLSGFTASTAGIGGPPVALLFRDAEGPEVRGSLGAFFVVGNILSLSGLAVAGRFGPDEIALGLVMTPAALIGFASTRWIVPIVDRGYTRTAILVVSATAALVLIGRLLILDG